MMGPGPCVAVELGTAPPAAYSVAVLEARCDAILGKGRCRAGGDGAGPAAEPGGTCWAATVTTTGVGPAAATVILRDSTRPERAPVSHDLSFRPHDAPADRWATVGLLIAALVTIEQHSSASEPPDGKPGSRRPTAAAAPLGSTPVTAVATPAPAPGTPLAWDLGAASVLAAGLSPGVAWGARVEAVAAGSRFGGTARFTYLPAQTRADASDPTHGGSFRLASIGGGGCVVGDRTRRLGWRACAGADVNATLARGFGIAEPASPSAIWGAAWAGAAARLRLHPHAAAWASVEGSAALRRPSFAIEGGAQIFTPSPVGATAALGLAVTW